MVPTGYSFNLDGTNIYMTLATLFIAQALHVDLSWGQLLTILLVAMLTSKGASGVTGAGFVTLAGTLAAADARLVPGLAIIFEIDKFMSEVRALTNIIGNGVATIVVSIWEGELDRAKMDAALADVDAEEAIVAAEFAGLNSGRRRPEPLRSGGRRARIVGKGAGTPALSIPSRTLSARAGYTAFPWCWRFHLFVPFANL